MTAPMAPAHLFGRKAIDLLTGDDGGMGVFSSRRLVIAERLRHQGGGLRAGGQGRCARGKSNGEFQKMAAFHDISLFARSRD
jgi:hypothetical protein